MPVATGDGDRPDAALAWAQLLLTVRTRAGAPPGRSRPGCATAASSPPDAHGRQGRPCHDDLDLALEAFRAPIQNGRLIEDELRHVEHDATWLPYSGWSVASGLDVRGVAQSGKTCVVPPEVSPSCCAGGSRDGRSRPEQQPAAVCSSCWQQQAVTGVCGCI